MVFGLQSNTIFYFYFIVWRAVSSDLARYHQEVLLVQINLYTDVYVHKTDLVPVQTIVFLQDIIR